LVATAWLAVISSTEPIHTKSEWNLISELQSSIAGISANISSIYTTESWIFSSQSWLFTGKSWLLTDIAII